MKIDISYAWRVMAMFLVAAAVMVIPMDAWATSAGTDTAVFQNAKQVTQTAWRQGKTIVYIIAGIGALALGVLAFFGRFKWTTFFALCGGIFVIAMIAEIIDYLGGVSTDVQP